MASNLTKFWLLHAACDLDVAENCRLALYQFKAEQRISNTNFPWFWASKYWAALYWFQDHHWQWCGIHWNSATSYSLCIILTRSAWRYRNLFQYLNHYYYYYYYCSLPSCDISTVCLDSIGLLNVYGSLGGWHLLVVFVTWRSCAVHPKKKKENGK